MHSASRRSVHELRRSRSDVRRLGRARLGGAPRATLRALAQRAQGRLRQRFGAARLPGARPAAHRRHQPQEAGARAGLHRGRLLRGQVQRPHGEGVHVRLREAGRRARQSSTRTSGPTSRSGRSLRRGSSSCSDCNLVDWPGRALSRTRPPGSTSKPSYMEADEYDALIADPEGYFRRALLPRFGSAFAPLAGLAPFSDMMEAASMPFSILPFADPAVAGGRAAAGRGRPGVLRLPQGDRRRGRRRGGSSGHPAASSAARPRLPTTSWPTRCAAPGAS